MTGSETFDLWALFVSAFVSSTLLPGGSEVVLGLLEQSGSSQTATIVAVATFGNTLGGLVTFAMGWWLSRHVSVEDKLSASKRGGLVRMRRYGWPALLLSWLPVVGDPLCFAAGWLRMSVAPAASAILVGKLLRYVVVVWLV